MGPSLAFADLASTTCTSAIDVCSQTAAALAQAAAARTAAGTVAVRVVTGTWAASNVHLADVVSASGGLPTVVTVTNPGAPARCRCRRTAPRRARPAADVAFGEGTGYVEPETAATHRGHRGGELTGGAPSPGTRDRPTTRRASTACAAARRRRRARRS